MHRTPPPSTQPAGGDVREAAFARLLEEWAAATPSLPTQLVDWTRAIERIAADERALRARGAWVHGRDDLLGVLQAQRRETLHSALIAWLLDPCGTHGLGIRFLAAFAARVFPDDTFDGLDAARTSCELARGPCRADIVIELPAGTIVVENKIDAVESPRQCDILFEQFSDDGCRFVFLTPRGSPPSTASGDATRAFACLSYTAIKVMLREALAGTAAAPGRGRHVAEDYLRTLDREFR